ncbi:hypothetical protein GVN16_14510 [Emticicia sp. CRIBPO]|uniref:Bax inhibitor-1/YccA family protein n=1 Tax=Emticicia sp. CRIBPO TaxID=2683258 RepID=UPI00141278CE|nr:Bax inhibitor-1/YccA family protein [Emticicia sp. CRIBPO]NBA86981.1 hypothetical protein [Emticicia sp. CRIBPO]
MANPVFSQKTLDRYDYTQDGNDVMTVNSTINKVGILLLLVFASAGFSWNAMVSGWTAAPAMITIGFIGAFVTAIILIFKKEWAPALAPTYAIVEGMALGALSALFGQLAFYAVGLTFGVVLIMWVLYKTGIIKATEKFAFCVTAATGAVALLYLVTWVLGMFHITVPFIHESGWVGIGLSGVIVTIAALNLILDFNMIETAAAQRAPKFMEWYASFALLLTIVWLYLEILRLLAKLRD